MVVTAAGGTATGGAAAGVVDGATPTGGTGAEVTGDVVIAVIYGGPLSISLNTRSIPVPTRSIKSQ